ncbi:MAG TPA: carboxymuconolactone decarboxylase family protein [Geopsychrobacteraceae bacterium]|nr:carboxymuconolactone decarboxylase family protein [Geopsychrobacteraceae bacterium]
MLSPDHGQAFRNFYDAMRDSVLDEKTTSLVGLAASMAVGCEP